MAASNLSFIGAMLTVCLWDNSADALPWSVTNPPGQAYMLSKYANLGAGGKGPMGSTAVCEVFDNNVTYQSASVSTPPMGEDWGTTLSPPNGVWPLGVLEVRLMIGTTRQAFNYFTSVNM